MARRQAQRERLSEDVVLRALTRARRNAHTHPHSSAVQEQEHLSHTVCSSMLLTFFAAAAAAVDLQALPSPALWQRSAPTCGPVLPAQPTASSRCVMRHSWRSHPAGGEGQKCSSFESSLGGRSVSFDLGSGPTHEPLVA